MGGAPLCTLPLFPYSGILFSTMVLLRLSVSTSFRLPRFMPKAGKELLGYSDVMITTHVLNRGGQDDRSPAEGVMVANPQQV